MSGEGARLRDALRHPNGHGGYQVTAAPPPSDCTVYCLVGAFVGSAAAGAFLSGAPIAQIATAFNGAPGAVLGMWAGSKVGPGAPYLLAGAVLVPSIIGGGLDVVTVGMGVGAVAGMMAAQTLRK